MKSEVAFYEAEAMNATGNGVRFPCVADHGVGIASIIYALFVVLAGACCLKFARLARRDRWESKGHFYGLALSVRAPRREATRVCASREDEGDVWVVGIWWALRRTLRMLGLMKPATSERARVCAWRGSARPPG